MRFAVFCLLFFCIQTGCILDDQSGSELIDSMANVDCRNDGIGCTEPFQCLSDSADIFSCRQPDEVSRGDVGGGVGDTGDPLGEGGSLLTSQDSQVPAAGALSNGGADASIAGAGASAGGSDAVPVSGGASAGGSDAVPMSADASTGGLDEVPVSAGASFGGLDTSAARIGPEGGIDSLPFAAGAEQHSLGGRDAQGGSELDALAGRELVQGGATSSAGGTQSVQDDTAGIENIIDDVGLSGGGGGLSQEDLTSGCVRCSGTPPYFDDCGDNIATRPDGVELCLLDGQVSECQTPVDCCTASGREFSDGECAECQDNFIGAACDRCRAPFVGENCDECPPRFAGPDCDRCADGHGGDHCAGLNGLSVELIWNTPADSDQTDEQGTDLDLHLRHPTATAWRGPLDCNYANVSPEWGELDDELDNPRLDIDDTNGAGPEVIILDQLQPTGQFGVDGDGDGLPDGRPYRIGVHYYRSSANLNLFEAEAQSNDYGPSIATVRIFIAGQLRFEASQQLEEKDDFWEVADLLWDEDGARVILRDRVLRYARNGPLEVPGTEQGSNGANICEACTARSDCYDCAGLPFCAADGACLECVEDIHCPISGLCHEGQCAECTEHEHCIESGICDLGTHTCTGSFCDSVQCHIRPPNEPGRCEQSDLRCEDSFGRPMCVEDDDCERENLQCNRETAQCFFSDGSCSANDEFLVGVCAPGSTCQDPIIVPPWPQPFGGNRCGCTPGAQGDEPGANGCQPGQYCYSRSQINETLFTALVPGFGAPEPNDNDEGEHGEGWCCDSENLLDCWNLP